jgi:hypothetical protein
MNNYTIKKILKQGKRIRIQYEKNYSSLNWGFIADFDVEKVQNRLLLYRPDFSFFVDKIPIEMSILNFSIIPKKGKLIFINCTGNNKWCDSKSTIEDIVKENKRIHRIKKQMFN